MVGTVVLHLLLVAALTVASVALTLPTPRITRMEIEVDEALLNSGVEGLCRRLEDASAGNRAAHVRSMQVDVSPDHPFARPCAGKKVRDKCEAVIDGESYPAICSDSFVRRPKSDDVSQGAAKQQQQQLICVPAIVLLAPSGCEMGDGKLPAGDECTLNIDKSYKGVCGHDPLGKKVGCYTRPAIRFLHILQHHDGHALTPVPAKVKHDGDNKAWTNVLVRRHGGASLCNAWKSESGKMPLALDFGTSPEGPLDGMSRIVLATDPHGDASLLRNALGTTILNSVIPVQARKVEFVRLYVNGRYHGLYTLIQDSTAEDYKGAYAKAKGSVEFSKATPAWPRRALQVLEATEDHEPEEPETRKEMILKKGERVFPVNMAVKNWAQVRRDSSQGWVPHTKVKPVPCGELPGTLYEPETDLSILQPQEFVPIDGVETQPTHVDPMRMHAALNNVSRLRDPGAWHSQLHVTLDVHEFLTWLAANTLLGNWDTYGAVPHNFRIYAEPCNGLLHFVGLDFDQILSADDRTPTLLHAGVSKDWPLIRILLDNPSFKKTYLDRAHELLDKVLPESLSSSILAWHAAISPFVVPSETGENEDFTGLDYDTFKKAGEVLAKLAESRRASMKQDIEDALKALAKEKVEKKPRKHLSDEL